MDEKKMIDEMVEDYEIPEKVAREVIQAAFTKVDAAKAEQELAAKAAAMQRKADLMALGRSALERGDVGAAIAAKRRAFEGMNRPAY